MQAFALLMEGLSSCCPSLHTLSVENNHVGAHGMVQVGKVRGQTDSLLTYFLHSVVMKSFCIIWPSTHHPISVCMY